MALFDLRFDSLKPAARDVGKREALRHALRVTAGLAAGGLLPERVLAQASSQPAAVAGSAGAVAPSGWNRQAFDAKTMADVMKALGVAAPTETREITLKAPDIAENGAIVPLEISTTLTGVRRLAILVDKNPSMLAAVFQLSDALEPNLNTRIKMNQSSWVYAVAITADGRTLFARRDVKITLGGCGA